MLELLPAAFGRALRGARPGFDAIAYRDAALAALPETLVVQSPVFHTEGPLPKLYTADGLGISPPIVFGGMPADARGVALLVEDADSPTPKPLVHAIAWGELARVQGFPEGGLRREELEMGLNSFMRCAYLPPDPPRGHGPHRYAFQVYACRQPLAFATAPGRSELVEALKRHALARGILVGFYERR